MKTGPLVSTIIPTYNRAASLGSAVQSVLKQTYKNVEVIVVDDGSTDDTQTVLHRYGARVRVITQENGGAANARNRGVGASRGEIIAFLDSDDLWEPAKLERQVALLQKADRFVPCCLCNALVHFSDGRVKSSFENAPMDPAHEEGIWLNVAEVLASRFVLFNQVVAIRRDAFERVGGFDGSLRYLEDYDLALRLALEGPWAFIREPLVIYGYASPQSLSELAHSNEFRLKEREISIFEGILERVKGVEQYAALRRQLNWRLRVFRRVLRAAKLSQASFPGASIVGDTLKLIERYRASLSRRSFWYPKMKTIPIQCAGVFSERGGARASHFPSTARRCRV